jgi:hypothetical protein
LCISCIAAESRVADERVTETLKTLGTALVLRAEIGRRGSCGDMTTVQSVHRPQIG